MTGGHCHWTEQTRVGKVDEDGRDKEHSNNQEPGLQGNIKEEVLDTI